MKKENTVKNTTKPMAYDALLCAGLRVKLHLAGIKPDSFLTNIPFVPRAGDLIEAENMIDEKNYTDDELDKIHTLSWSVWYVNWGKDKDGYFAEIVCEGE